MKINLNRKFNMSGFTHIVAPIVIIAAVSVVGVYVVVHSFAASNCAASSVSSPASTPASSPCTPPVYSAKCTISVSPATVKVGHGFTANIKVVNTGNRSFSPKFSGTVIGPVSTTVYNSSPTLPSLAPGKTETGKLITSTATKLLPANSRGSATVMASSIITKPKFQCQGTFAITK